MDKLGGAGSQRTGAAEQTPAYARHIGAAGKQAGHVGKRSTVVVVGRKLLEAHGKSVWLPCGVACPGRGLQLALQHWHAGATTFYDQDRSVSSQRAAQSFGIDAREHVEDIAMAREPGTTIAGDLDTVVGEQQVEGGRDPIFTGTHLRFHIEHCAWRQADCANYATNYALAVSLFQHPRAGTQLSAQAFAGESQRDREVVGDAECDALLDGQ